MEIAARINIFLGRFGAAARRLSLGSFVYFIQGNKPKYRLGDFKMISYYAAKGYILTPE